MDVSEVLTELYGRVPDLVDRAVDGLTAEQLTRSPGPGANTVGWLTWHLARVLDASLAEVVEEDQVWVTGGWAPRFGLEPDPSNSGYGHSAEEMAAVRPESAAAIIGYLAAAVERVDAFLAGLGPDDLDRVVDENWDPPVTLGVRLISVADDAIQHAGQAAYVRGLLA